VLLLTLLVVLFDRYRAVYVARFAAGDSGDGEEKAQVEAVAAA
jgi:hypothetical protein